MNKSILNIQEYFSLGTFVIPNYQRGYKWGVKNEEDKDAVSVLLINLINAFDTSFKDYFVQGVTVYEEIHNDKRFVYLIDGQQRTTTFFLMLKYLNYNQLPEINYAIREESKYVLNSCKIQNSELLYDIPSNQSSQKYDFQDIYYFSNAINIIDEKLKNINKEEFTNFILERVKLFYITIAKDNATKVFSMLNGQKAKMKTDELIKASLLSKAAQLPKKEENYVNSDLSTLLQLIKNQVGVEWEINQLRNKYAREWDKWLYWWNRNEVKSFFNSGENPMGLLLEYYFEIHKTNIKDQYTFSNFSEVFFINAKTTKQTFKGLRDFQKTFEDWFNQPKIFNYLGLIIKGGGDKKKAILFFYSNGTDNIKEYAIWSLIGASHHQITEALKDDEETKEAKADNAFLMLKEPYIYWNEQDEEFNDNRKEIAFRQFLRINAELDIELNRKFDFSIWENRSLEHILPKSRKNEISWDSMTSVHCIGNLVLLFGRDNSSFGALDYDDKKNKLFSYFLKSAG